MSLNHMNGVQPSDSEQVHTPVIPDSQFVPGNTVFGNRYPRAFKLKVLQETDACSKPGELGRYLRQHALTHATLTCFRKQRASGALDGPSTQPTAKGNKNQRNSKAHESARRSEETKRLM